MVTWRCLSAEEARPNWDKWLSGFNDYHVKQTWAWGAWKRNSWEVIPTALLNGETPMAMALGLLRKAPVGAATVLWINGGPVFRKDRPIEQDFASLSKYLEGLKSHLATYSRPVLRLNLAGSMDLEAQLVLRQRGFVRPLLPLDTGLTYVVELNRSLDELMAGLERNWRNQLRRAEAAAPEITFGSDFSLWQRYLPLHNELVERKGLRAQSLSLADLERMSKELGGQIEFMVVKAQGKDGCGGALWTFKEKAYFALSAANAWGLERNLPNFMYWRAITRLKDAGFKKFDLTGIDPLRNWGVFNFKRGLQARAVEQLGEWEWSPSPWTRRAFNLGLWLKQGSLA